jgi:hypothetical protein
MLQLPPACICMSSAIPLPPNGCGRPAGVILVFSVAVSWVLPESPVSWHWTQETSLE